jgi:hypothetical protein
MHRPGYVQGGQEAKCGYLLLGIYYRRIPGDIATNFYKLVVGKSTNFNFAHFLRL